MRDNRGTISLEALLLVYLFTIFIWGIFLLQESLEKRNNAIREHRNRAVAKLRA